MLIGKDKVSDMIAFNKAVKWWLKRSENSAPIYKFEGDHSNDEAIAAFEKVFETLEPGLYFIDCWTGDDKRSRQKTPFRKEGTSAVNPDASIGGVSIGDIGEIERQAVEKYKKEEHYKELEEKIKGLEKTQNNFFFKLGSTLEPYIPELIGALTKSLGGNPANVTGNQTMQKKQHLTKTKPMNEEVKENLNSDELTELLNTWYEKDPDALVLIQKLVNMIDNDPKTYQFAKNYLMGNA